MVASFHSCGTSPVIYTATTMSWNASKISWELSESSSLSSSAGSSFGPIALPLAIDLRVFFVSLTAGGSPSDRAVGFCDRPSIIVRLRVDEVVLSKEVKYRLYLARISSRFRKSFPFSSLIYCALLNFLPCNFHPPLRCPCQPLKSPATMNSSSSQANISKYLSSAAWIISLSVLHAFRSARKAEPPAKVPCAAFRASSLSVQASSNSLCIASSSNNPNIRDCRIWPGVTSSDPFNDWGGTGM